MSGDKQTTSDPIPLVSKLEDIYSSRDAQLKQGQRWDALTQRFEKDFGSKPDFIARAPGRVNVIGEHVDHMGFGVLPAAIELDILMVVRVVPADEGTSSSSSSSTIQFDLANSTDRFERATFFSDVRDAASVELIHDGPTRWANYFKVAWKGLHPHLPSNTLSDRPPSRIEVLVDGTIPPESSLSSSAAMTVCSSIVILEALGARDQVSRREMAEVAIESERYVGVASGGMDQSASIFGEPDSVLHITFHPGLAISRVSMPKSDPECTFLIANSLVVSDKKVNGPVQYNLRVVELLVASRIFCLSVGIDLPSSGPQATPTWRQVVDLYFKKYPLSDKEGDEEVQQVRQELGEEAAQLHVLSQLVESHLPPAAIDLEEAKKLTKLEQGDDFAKAFLQRFDVRTEQGFECLKRTRHVFAEALRVWRFKAQLQSGREGKELYEELGEMMNQSHESLARDYSNTCPELESLVTLARTAGSLGSRLTGAGWGGSTVHLVPKAKVGEVLQAWKEGYYAKRWPEISGNEEKLGEAMLESRPAGGACVMRL